MLWGVSLDDFARGSCFRDFAENGVEFEVLVETLDNGPTLGRSKWVVISEFGGGRFAVRSVNSGSTTRLEWRGWPTGVRGPKV